MSRLRHDLNHLTSTGLLVAALATGLTGLVADLWDLNDFWYHTLAGYVMGAFAIAHVVLNWRTLVNYAKFRLVRRSARPAAAASSPRPPATALAPGAPFRAAGPTTLGTAGVHPSTEDQVAPWRWLGRAALSRRGVLGLAAGGAAGWLVGRGLRQPPPIPGGSDLGVLYHQWSKPGVIDVLGSVADWGQQPPLYKEYPDAATIALPEPAFEGGLSTEEAILARRSTRDYSGAPIQLDDLSRLLYLTSGLTGERWGRRYRTAPSSGALYPIEIYPVVHNVEGLASGIYHYGYRGHRLELLRAGDFRSQVVQQGLMQEYLGQCSAVLFLTMIQQRMRYKYKDRTYRYGLLEAGHLGQNLYLAATSTGLGACAIGAFMDDDINAMLGLDGIEEAAVYMLAVGDAKGSGPRIEASTLSPGSE
jgi:SagB-type dehydrogenase family enzyme